jgi:hypothetical protein
MPMTNLSEAKVKDFNDIVIAQVDTKIFLLNKPSGTFSFFDMNLKLGDFIPQRHFRAGGACSDGLVRAHSRRRLCLHSPLSEEKITKEGKI